MLDFHDYDSSCVYWLLPHPKKEKTMDDYCPSIWSTNTYDDGYDQGWRDAVEAVCKLSEDCSFPLSRHVIEVRMLLGRDEDEDSVSKG